MSSLIHLFAEDTAKIVRKPWGEERWLVEGDAPFVMKLIVLKAGQRTSLQFHERKEEANLILDGAAWLRYRDDGEGGGQGQSQLRRLEKGAVVHIRPGAIHRIEAETDLLMLEVSTPEVDDVVRVEDDWNRPDGRIHREHDAQGSPR